MADNAPLTLEIYDLQIAYGQIVVYFIYKYFLRSCHQVQMKQIHA